ncbi:MULTISPECIES: TetR/AcrR family transcriptional regulator [unclassified Nostoc]|uniref:TetR/AcrR family transcriptional regulator n=1 Tax=unclassified Nostoc TaxID=2593658 RepID=UPI0026120844|nr:TetR/AcrR family transcriptional regulator [Nostoc sp. S13]MDF5739629.1 TetR/AcrR family transcriptional regulator [Nostoc sp. S13]
MSNVKSVERDLSSEKTEAILRGAMQEFMEHGYAGARIDKIVAAAGVSKATVYRRFADKETLFTALIQRMAEKVNFFEQQDFPSSEEEPVVFLKRHATKMLNCAAENPQDIALFRIVIGESGRFPELGRAFLQNIEKPNLDFITQYFATHPKLQLANPEVAARTFIATLLHIVTTRYLLHGGDIMPIEDDRLINGLLDLIIHPSKSVRL